ncbi:hypothetical protein Poly51_22870 [Rubripirellula tenax]|uniref:Uncharacterized protein n=1 Tax=Rubripirellula tenax TaxID=2528015 RepID=A0A5C6F7F7_9BACT|nr:hypothetical protein Poly51_22870 [Rubripirellula tenax]
MVPNGVLVNCFAVHVPRTESRVHDGLPAVILWIRLEGVWSFAASLGLVVIRDFGAVFVFLVLVQTAV